MEEKRFGLSASALRALAMTLMLLDHLWASVVPGNNWMTWVGRMAFPIFAFQAAEGYCHTSNYNKYIRRLLLFALLSEIPFNLFYIGAPVFPFHQNVMFTLLLGLLLVRQLDPARRGRGAGSFFKRCAIVWLILLVSVITFPDYGMRGVLTVAAFYVAGKLPMKQLWYLAALIGLNVVGFKGEMLPFMLGGMELHFPVQGFAVFAILPVCLYNGRKGGGGKALQYGSYVFYPAHMLALHLIRILA